MSQHPVPVFILGSARSGTTVTASLLSQLPGVQIVKETGFVAQHVAQLQDIANPASLRRVIDAANSWLKPGQVDKRASLEGFSRFCALNDIHGGGAFLHYVWQLNSPKPWRELSFIGDNTPLYVMAIPQIQSLMPNARFIHMVRDPRDVVASILTMRFGADDAAVAALEWHVYVGCWMMAERLVAAERRIECRYEDLCTTPAATFGRLARFLECTEADAAEALARHVGTGSQFATGFEEVAAEPHHTRITEPLSSDRIGRYKSELTDAQIRSIEEIAQCGMLAYHYEPSRWHIHPLLHENRISLLRSMVKDVGRRSLKRLRERLGLA
jgi:hypothetical protein